jgi:hypothetical protein
MFVEARAQLARRGGACRGARGERDVHRRQFVLMPAERFARDALDLVACDGGAEGARGDRKSQTRMSFMIGQNG